MPLVIPNSISATMLELVRMSAEAAVEVGAHEHEARTGVPADPEVSAQLVERMVGQVAVDIDAHAISYGPLRAYGTAMNLYIWSDARKAHRAKIRKRRRLRNKRRGRRGL